MAVGDINKIEKWRKKYFGQAVVLTVLIMLLFFYVIKHIEMWSFVALFLLVGCLICYKIILALQVDFQSMCEGLLLSKKDNFHYSLRFDAGKSLVSDMFDRVDFLPIYDSYECKNVLKGEKFSLEEGGFYSKSLVKHLDIRFEKFKGLILALKVKIADEEKNGKIELIENKVIVSGELAGELKRHDVHIKIANFLRFFKASSVDVVTDEGNVYFFIPTNEDIYYQFKLSRTGLVSYFTKRIENIRIMVENIAELLKI